MQKYVSFDPDVRAPAQTLPAGAFDAHFHVFGDPARYPILPGIEHVIEAATPDAVKRLHARLGISRGLIVATTAHGTDHRIVLDALEALGPGYRACALAAVLTDTSDDYLEKLHAAGVRGARFGFLKEVGRGLPLDKIGRALARCRELGWYAKVQPDYHVPLESIALFEHLDIPVIIDHMGRARPEEGPDGAAISKVVELLKRGNFWVLLSNPYKVSNERFPWRDVMPIVRRYIETAPDRVIWASDWPHTFHTVAAPNDGELVDFLLATTDEAERRAILVDNPNRLFGMR